MSLKKINRISGALANPHAHNVLISTKLMSGNYSYDDEI